MTDTPGYWGLDVRPLANARADVIKAIKTANLVGYRAAWDRYRELADILTKASSDARLGVGLLLATADIWREVKDRVHYWRDLLDAEIYADNLNEVLVNAALDRASRSLSFKAEFFQATKLYNEAIAAYIEREQDECLTNLERGLVNLRLAECYLELLAQDGPNGSIDLRDLFDASVASALEYLKNQPEQIRALRLLEEYE